MASSDQIITPETFQVPPTAHSPNSMLPVVVYRGVLATAADRTADAAVGRLAAHGWVKGGHWQIAREEEAKKPHYHVTTHEAYTVLRGSGTYMLGKSPLDPDVDVDGRPVGVRFTARPGDVFAWPAGIMHHVIDVDEDYEIIGFYQLTGRNSPEVPYDMEYGFDSVEETDKKRQQCELVPTPGDDPLYGKDGPVTQLWKRH